ncbi:3'(2'),5'-bisphosphate nucleotidase CysQ [Gilvimarinus sp. DA14]|uniref:3'(2'),5'-bisphosphate nucleotidase CysQ n=1 Tax=Gilvimarinus sp. DA14 TaxID=2956798 RepID=UPI0020B8BA72|nr:3'(2'),5'-bisphosphate nucleotidase CysQ [Gilvimarinus sp. DA14]UTF59623.1 3'(2'),5'-bisphosphate nucleotidase CysQ [Gilvimarinus sp. DA14]
MSNTPDYPQVIETAEQAGDLIMQVYQRDFSVAHKDDDSPLTEADLAAHQHIQKALESLTPDIPVLSEESADISWHTRQAWREYWLVDPLDGTKEFIKKNDEFTVNIAHIVDGHPVWGVVVAPALGITYYGGRAVDGSFKVKDGDTQAIRVADVPTDSSGWCIVGSRSHQSEAFADFIARFDNPRITSMGSSLKICLVAEGQAHLYPRLGPTSEWDTGAAHAVLVGAGGKIIETESGRHLPYNQKESVLNPYFIAAADAYQS